MQANCSRRTQTLSDGHYTSVGGLLLRNASCLTIVASTRLLWPGSTCTLSANPSASRALAPELDVVQVSLTLCLSSSSALCSAASHEHLQDGFFSES